MEVIKNAYSLVVGNIEGILAFIGFFALIATKTPNKVDNQIVQVLADVVNFLGANVDKASNKE